MIKNIVFDLGNVIIQWNPNYIVSQYTKDPTLQKELLHKVFNSSYWLAFDEGSLTREEVIQNIEKTIDCQHHALITDIIYHWYQHCPMIEGIASLIKEIKEQGYHIYLLSNTNIHFEEYRDTLPVMKYFDGFYISAKTRKIKPNPEIFLHFLETFDLLKEECLFIDDIEKNVQGACKVGMHGYHFNGDTFLLKQYIDTLKPSC